MASETTRVQTTRNGQFRLTVPRAKGLMLDLGQADVVWRVNSSESLRMTVVSRDGDTRDEVRTTRVQHRPDNGQYIATIPPGLAEAMRLRDAKVSWHDHSRDSIDVRVESRGGDK